VTIYFYRVNDPYGCFSNFSPHGFEADGRHWPTSEHYFQAKKFAGTAYEEQVRTSPTPMAAARLGRDRSLPLRQDWEAVKDNIMREAVRLKFSANREICNILLATGDEELVEKTTDDYYWGCGTQGTGQNMLGRILMELREQLRREPTASGR
jgi:N-glycosidase YbiA